MKKIFKENYPNNYFVDIIPEVCPFCNRSVDFSYNWIDINEYNIETRYDFFYNEFIDVVFKCPSPDCYRLIIYSYSLKNLGSREGLYDNYYISEKYLDKNEFSPSIRKISPKFIEIYHQAMIAESEGLNEIVGLSLRKSFEFLIKDYIISTLESNDTGIIEKVKIELKFQKLLKEYFQDNAKILDLSSRVAWLGNDEAHYIRKHINHDVSDIKILIKLVINYIDNDFLYKKYLQEL